jgi:hypothetical protein
VLSAQDWVMAGFVLILGAAALPGIIAPSWLGDLITVASGVLAMLVAGLAARRRMPLILPLRHLAPSLILIAAVALWVLFQASSLWGGPWQHPLWRLAADALAVPPDSAISLDPAAGISGLLVLLRSVAMIWIAFQLATASRRARHLLLAVAVAGAAYALLAPIAALLLTMPPRVDETAVPAVAGLCLLAVVTLRVARVAGTAPEPVLQRSTAAKLRAIVAWSGWPMLAISFFSAALIVAAGRTGILTSLIGLLAFPVAIAAVSARAHDRHRLCLALSLAFVLGAVCVELFVASGRMQASRGFDPRGTTIQAVAAQAIADAPLLGTGYGTFPSVAHLYGVRASDLGKTGPGFYLQNMVELGVPAGIALVLACAGLLVLCAKGVQWRRRNAIFPCLGIGAIALTASNAVAGASVQDPLPALIWCTIMGVACAQSLPTVERHKPAQPG